ncbi:MAG: DUF1841 family protein [Xanthomonadaceae bacterium]|nr:DUF1841 family protein [Xanthomonadaceae bacterium]
MSDDRRSMRKRFVLVWEKMQARTPLEPLEAVIAEVIEAHPEYQPLLGRGDAALDDEWTPERGETNPFLHLGLHVAIREQIAADRPTGVKDAYRALCRHTGDTLAAEHRMIECLATALWEAGRSGAAPDEAAYLDCLWQNASRHN